MKPDYGGSEMDFITAMELIMAHGRTSYSDLARACGVRVGSMIARFERRSDLHVSTAARMADAAGYRLALVPSDSRLPKGSISIRVEEADRHLRAENEKSGDVPKDAPKSPRPVR